MQTILQICLNYSTANFQWSSINILNAKIYTGKESNGEATYSVYQGIRCSEGASRYYILGCFAKFGTFFRLILIFIIKT